MNAIEFLWAIGRATVFTSAAVLLAISLVALLRVRSPRLHRAAWFLAVMPSWLLVPWTWRVETPPVVTAADSVGDEILTTVTLSHSATIAAAIPEATAAHVSPEQLLLIVFLGGLFAVVVLGTLRYLRFVRRLPRPEEPLEPEWQCEWQRQLLALRSFTQGTRGARD
jgi:hypothetical protein